MLFDRKSPPPVMTLEGALGPNRRLDEAQPAAARSPNALCVAQDGLLFSSGSDIWVMPEWGQPAKLWRSFEAAVTALARSQDGAIAIGLEGGRLAVCDATGADLDGWSLPSGIKSVVDCQFLPHGELVVLDNGYAAAESYLSVAPWDDRHAGQLVSITRHGIAKVLAAGLHCPMGLAASVTGDLIVTEMERARIVNLKGEVLRLGFPGYVGRLRRTSDGYVLACLGRRDPLIEFLKTEPDFVTEMKARVASEHWIGPRANPDFSHDFPIELGATRLFGEIKPWAPSFSYGLLIELDDDLMPVGSAHSRADGRRHHITDAVDWNGDLIAVSGASQELLNLGSRRE
jgi:hypothetical protein